MLVLFLGIILTATGCTEARGLDAALDSALKAGRPVMIEFGSKSCIPCKKMVPVMDRLRENYKGNLDVIFVDVNEDRKTPRAWGVMVIPTQVFLNGKGEEVHRHTGFYPYEEITPVLKRIGL